MRRADNPNTRAAKPTRLDDKDVIVLSPRISELARCAQMDKQANTIAAPTATQRDTITLLGHRTRTNANALEVHHTISELAG
jgi:hypothetical protein